ncbi:putative F-box/LRR-repeat protein [Acorus calamus]|uniref:F-box/LRR-repeat protein n=1 Tax=Acorus calamus TaxID=4465 RepID=A0AAV9FE04_ACOCL|nr:putative F-box/LRR-repeat protein [Acorus calamus]
MEDRITALPDNIICSILSLLSMRDAVRTSVLSSKWRYLALFYPNLSFESNNILGNRFSIERFDVLDDNERIEFRLKKKLNFVKAVDQFFALRPYGVKMKSLRICLSLDVDHASHLDQWIEFAFSSDIESLHLALRESMFNKPGRENYKGDLINFSFAKVEQVKNIGFDCEGYCPRWIKYAFTNMPPLLPRLESLNLFSHEIRTEFIPDYFPQFTYLKKLEVTHSAAPEYDHLWMITILRACPIVEEIHINFITLGVDDMIYKGEVAKLEPRCPLNRLKVVELSGFTCFWSQIDLAVRILRNAVVLETMTIDCRLKMENDDGELEILGYYDYVRRWRRRINRFLSKRVPEGAKLVIL